MRGLPPVPDGGEFLVIRRPPEFDRVVMACRCQFIPVGGKLEAFDSPKSRIERSLGGDSEVHDAQAKILGFEGQHVPLGSERVGRTKKRSGDRQVGAVIKLSASPGIPSPQSVPVSM